MRDAHGFDRCRNGASVHERHVLADASESDVRAERLSVERDLATPQLRTDPLSESEQGWSSRADAEPDDTRPIGGREAAGVVDLYVERGDLARGGLSRVGHSDESRLGHLAEKGQRHVHELGPHATERGELWGAAERRLGDLGGEWERDEEPYPGRLERCGDRLVRDKLRDEHHCEKTAEARERGHAKTLAVRDAFPCVGDQSHCDTWLSKQRAACHYTDGVTRTSQTRYCGVREAHTPSR